MIEPTEAWTERLAALARMLRTDAIAVATLSDDRLQPLSAWGLREPGWMEGAGGATATTAFQQRAIQHRPGVEIPLADGRTAAAVLAAPIVRRGMVTGAVVAFRATEPFVRADAGPLAALADLVGAELASDAARRRGDRQQREIEARARQAEIDRAHALALYELAHGVAHAGDAARGLERAAGVIADTLDADLAAIWLTESDGRLRCAAARGYVGVPAPVRADGDPTLVRVALGQRVEAAHFDGGAPAWAGGVSDALLAPIVVRGIVRGVVIQGRLGRGFDDGERALGALVADALAPLCTADPQQRPPSPPQAPAPPPAEAEIAVAAVTPETAEVAPSHGGSRIVTVLTLILAIGAAAAGYAALGPIAYLAAAVLLLIALLSFRG